MQIVIGTSLISQTSRCISTSLVSHCPWFFILFTHCSCYLMHSMSWRIYVRLPILNFHLQDFLLNFIQLSFGFLGHSIRLHFQRSNFILQRISILFFIFVIVIILQLLLRILIQKHTIPNWC